MKRRLSLALAVSASFGLLLTSCNTWVGIGRDVQKLGQGMENQAYKKNTPATTPPVYNGQ